MAFFVTRLGLNYGLWFATKTYLAPYLIFNAWIAIVTHMHHTHPDVPWYSGSKEWTFVKGALSTVDRNYGIIEDIHHNIGTHVVHHLFSKIPHYNIVEATKHIKPVVGDHHRVCNDSILTAMWTAMVYCRFVPNTSGVLYYVNNWQELLMKTPPSKQQA